MERKRRLTVEIIGSKNDQLWYRDMIGKTIKVKDEGHPEHLTASSKEHISKIIYREDCKEL
jgi:hypothetical protein